MATARARIESTHYAGGKFPTGIPNGLNAPNSGILGDGPSPLTKLDAAGRSGGQLSKPLRAPGLAQPDCHVATRVQYLSAPLH